MKSTNEEITISDATIYPSDERQQLTIANQKNEIMELKLKLQKTLVEKASKLEDSLFSPSLYEHYKKIAVMLSNSGAIPDAYKKKPEDIFVAMAMGYQLGFAVEQSLQDISVINGRPCLWGDGLKALCIAHPACVSIEEEPINKNGELVGFRCTVVRKNHKPHSQEFTLDDAKQAGLLSRPVWSKYPKRMLQMRARSWALRDKFPDALRGIRIEEEVQDYEEEPRTIKTIPDAPTQTETVKALLKHDTVETSPVEKVAEPKQTPKKVSAKENPQPKSPSKIDDKMVRELEELMEKKGFPEHRKQKAFEHFKVESLQEFNYAQAAMLLEEVEKSDEGEKNNEHD